MSDEPEASPYSKPLPEPNEVTRPFWEAARQHRLCLQRSKTTGKYVFYPRIRSPFGAGDELEWVDVSGRGTVYSFTVARRPTAAQWAPDVPYAIAIVELDEGPHMTANIVGCDAGTVKIGMRVVADFADVTPEVTLVQFRPADPLPG
ncbi:MAG: Zn-ribbon domain-containing OB-fold protein [Dehalococcoidia bacterium]